LTLYSFCVKPLSLSLKSVTAPKGGDIASEIALYQITEYEQVGYPPTLRFLHQSGTLGLRDASRFAAAISYALGEYVSVISSDPVDNPYYEWWYAGALWRVGCVPPPEMRDNLGLESPPERGIVEMSAEMAEDRRRLEAERSRKVEMARSRTAGHGA
jgi:hypothetical protein